MANRDAGSARRGTSSSSCSRSANNFAGNRSAEHRRFETSAAQSENNPASVARAAAVASASAVAVNNNSTLARWPLAKYANLIASKTLATPGSGTWQERTSARLDDQRQPNDMWIQITQRRYVQVLHGDVLLESSALSSARQEWRAMRKGPNMLFIITKKGTSRKFRIRFHDQEGATKEDASASAEACARHLSGYFTIFDADRQGHAGVASARTEDANSHQQTPCNVSLEQLARSALNHQAKWPPGCIGNDVPQQLVPDLVLSCLMDPSFPDFVEAVERSLKSLTTSSPDERSASHGMF